MVGLGLGLLVAWGCDPSNEGVDVEQGVAANDLGDEHQFVELRIDGSEPERLAQTTTIRAMLYYSDCLSSFYIDEPQWGYAGSEGRSVFERAEVEGLCLAEDPELVQCAVTGIRQEFHGDDLLVIDFEVTGELADRRLRVGPLPTPQRAECGDDTPNFVGHVGLWGMEQTGDLRWVSRQLALVPADQDRPAEVSIGDP